MRVQQLALRVHGDEIRLHFSGRLTVIGGLSVDDRHGLVEVLLGTLAGAPTVSSELALVDRTGRRVVVDQTAEGTFHTSYDDGSLALAPSTVLGLDVHDLFRLMYLGPEHLGLADTGPAEPPELTEARAALAALTDQLEAARVANDAAEALRVELVAIERQIRTVDADRPRRRYARILLELEKLRAEREALCAAAEQAENDRAVSDYAAALRPLAQAWREAHSRLEDQRRRFGDRQRLDAHTLNGALNIPDRVPVNLDQLVERLAEAEAQRAALSARLAGVMAKHVQSPSHPDVARLARHHQDRVWATAERAVQTGLALEHESLAAGGLVAEGEAPAIVQEIERAHLAVEQAQQILEKRRFGAMAAGGAAALGAVALPLAPVVAPLALAGAASAAWWAILSPRQQLAEAQGWEDAALDRAGLPSYLALHLRRIDAMNDPAVRQRLERVTTAHRAAMAEWRSLAGDLSPLEALELEEEVRAYAASVAALDGLGEDVDLMRRRLSDEIEPAVERAREELMEVCRPFGIENPTLAADLVRQLAEVAASARLQQELEAAEVAERQARHPVEEQLQRLRVPEGELLHQLSAFEDWAAACDERIRFRARGRKLGEVDAEIARLDELSVAEYRPEYGTVFTPADAVEPDPAELVRRRELTATAYYTAKRLVPDVERISDRRSAVERRVRLLEETWGEDASRELASTRVASIERELQERIAALRHVGPGGEPLPLLVDDCFANLRPDVKWRMLDLLDRLAGAAQIVYLTQDPGAATWGRRRAAGGTVTFLDPVREPVPY